MDETLSSLDLLNFALDIISLRVSTQESVMKPCLCFHFFPPVHSGTKPTLAAVKQPWLLLRGPTAISSIQAAQLWGEGDSLSLLVEGGEAKLNLATAELRSARTAQTTASHGGPETEGCLSLWLRISPLWLDGCDFSTPASAGLTTLYKHHVKHSALAARISLSLFMSLLSVSICCLFGLMWNAAVTCWS